MGLGRRAFLKLSVAGTVVAGLGAAWFLNDNRNVAQFLRAILDKNLGHRLALDEEGLDRFVAAYESRVRRLGGRRFKIVAGFYPLYVNTSAFEMPVIRDEIYWIERDVVHDFLMGSDFFYDVAAHEAGKPLVFRELHDRFPGPCSNPFGEFA